MLELRDDRPFDPDVRVAPLRGVSRVPLPTVVDREPAAESDPAVHRHDPPVGPVADPFQGVDPQRLVDLDPHARRRHLVFELSQLRAEPVHQHPHFHAGPGPLRQRARELVADLSAIEDVQLQVDGLARAADRLEQGAERLVPVAQERGAVVRGQLRPEDLERSPEVRAVHAVGRLVLVDRPGLGKDVGAAGGPEGQAEAEERRRAPPFPQGAIPLRSKRSAREPVRRAPAAENRIIHSHVS